MRATAAALSTVRLNSGSDERNQSGLLKVAAHLGNVALAANQTARGEG